MDVNDETRTPPTDGGPGGQATQPIRVGSGGAYGERKMLTDMQRQNPLPQATPLPGPSPAPLGGTGGGPPGAPGIDPFGPSNRPLEPGDAGLNPTAAIDTVTALRILYTLRPSAAIAAMLRRAEQAGDSGMDPRRPVR